MSKKKVVLASASGLSDATLTINPGRKGFKKYKIHYTLEDGGKGKTTVLTVSYRLANGQAESVMATNTTATTSSGDLEIKAAGKVVKMSARVTRVEGHLPDFSRATDHDVFT